MICFDIKKKSPPARDFNANALRLESVGDFFFNYLSVTVSNLLFVNYAHIIKIHRLPLVQCSYLITFQSDMDQVLLSMRIPSSLNPTHLIHLYLLHARPNTYYFTIHSTYTNVVGLLFL